MEVQALQGCTGPTIACIIGCGEREHAVGLRGAQCFCFIHSLVEEAGLNGSRP